MSLGVAFFFLAAGAILRYAVEKDLWANVSEDMVGAILMIVGLAGILLSLFAIGTIRSFARRNDSDVIVRKRGRGL